MIWGHTSFDSFRGAASRPGLINLSAGLIDLVVDRAPEVDTPGSIHGIRIHSLREIGANKICALVGRAEIRDLVDLRAILAKGMVLENLLADAERKDAGASPATLAWLMDSLRIGPDARLPAGVTATELDEFRSSLVADLRRLALPG